METAETPLIYDGKAVVTDARENGDLIIEGFAAFYEGEDRQGENFMEGAFKDAIAKFLAGSAALCYHHKTSMVLGKVLALKETAQGLWMKARVDGAIRNDPSLRTIYNQIKRGTISGLSIGGFFGRKLTPEGIRISKADFTEISCTAVPSLPNGTSFKITDAKALEADALRDIAAALDLAALKLEVAGMILAAR